MKTFSQEQWCDLTARIAGKPAGDEMEEVIGTRSNPADNGCDMTDTPEDAVCISDEIVADLKARADWLWQDGQEETANTLIDFIHTLETATPSREMVVAALSQEGKA
jgi:hypothetical protein